MNIRNTFIRHLINCLLIFYIIPLPIFCQHFKETEFTWTKEVLEYYRKSEEQEKFKAASFLIKSMPGHHSPISKALLEYVEVARNFSIPCSQDSLSHNWHKIISLKGAKIDYIEDTLYLDKNFLITHIEQAFDAWKNAPWHKDICFDDFCHYILPYRVSDEMLNYKGRKVFTSKYAKLIQGETDIIKAFTVVCSTFYKRIRQINPQCPYTLDAYTIDYLQQGNCLQRCILLTEVLRSLGIPCTIDIVPVWANYSQVGHSWVVMPYKGKNYTWRERDSIARSENPIDASYFPVTYQPSSSDSYPYLIENIKKTAKVYRLCYEKEEWKDKEKQSPTLFTQRIKDVSALYGLKDSITFTLASMENQLYYLCTFQTGKGWTPIAYTSLHNNQIKFINIGKDIVYIIATYERGILNPIYSPFLFKGNKIKFFTVDKYKKIKCRIYRTYSIFSQWTNQWGNMIGGTFEGSNNEDFSNADTLSMITSIPFGETVLPINTNFNYRYVRYQSTLKSRTPLAELAFYNKDKKLLKGIPISHKSLNKSKERVFDGNIKTEGATKQTNYWIGLDLGDTLQTISHIKFFPKNDGNFVTRGNFYELFYYENGWHSLGERFSVENYVEYYIPKGALLWLKCDTGHEERIFEYDNDRQIWY